jgi:hypothetical protein
LTDLLNVRAGNGYVFAANGSRGLTVFAVGLHGSDPIGHFPTAPRPFDLAVDGNQVYLANGVSGLQIIDIGEPTTPTLKGSATGAVYSVATVGAYALAGTTALTDPSTASSTLAFLDVSDPMLPRYTKSFQGGIPLRITTSGNQAFTLAGRESPGPPVSPDSFFMGARPRALDTYDLSGREKPILVDSAFTDYAYYWARSLAVKGNYAFLADCYGQCLSILDLTDHSKKFTQPTTGSIRGLTIADDRLAVAKDNGLELFDISYPTKPRSRGRFGVVGDPAYSFSDAAIAGQYIVAVNTDSGLHVIDASTTNLVEVGRYAFPGSEKVVIAGRYALVSHATQGLTILDLGPSFVSVPKITIQPQNRRVVSGATVRFDVGVNGSVPLSYQWRSNGANIPSATNSVLTLANVQFGQAGPYAVVITNSAGSVTSSIAVLSIDSPPSVTLTNPSDGQAFASGASIPLMADASDSDGTIAQVAFYQDGNLLGVVSNPPFSLTWSNVPTGTHLVTARAMDNEGATTLSSPVTVVVTTDQVFQLSKSHYEVNESNLVVTVTVQRNVGGVASVKFATRANTAKAVAPGAVGQYFAVSNTLSFDTNELSKVIPLTNVNDLVYRGNLDYLVELSGPSAGFMLAQPSNAVITIFDDESRSANVFPDVVPPINSFSPGGSLTIYIEPPEALASWRFPWETAWRDSGGTASNLVAGDYPVRLIALDGYGPLTNATYTVQGGTNHTYTNQLTPTGVTGSGNLTVKIFPAAVANPANPDRGQWRLRGTTIWQDSEAVVSGLPGGLHAVEFRPVFGLETPALLYAKVVTNRTLVYHATYAANANGLSVLPNYSTVTNGWASGLPYAICGQLFTAAGYGTGFVVKRHTVLTAAHVVFDPVTLSYVDGVWWFFQRHAGEHESPPLEPRGWYILDGYAAERRNDFLGRHFNSNESSPESEKRDVAALFFAEPQGAGGGGYGGFLTSDPTGHVWVADASLKMLIGYPVENIAETNIGKMYKAGPDFFAFDPLSAQYPELYKSPSLPGLPGMSGGPVCVQSFTSISNLFFLPAAVYLGGSDAGIARLIDIDVVDLINRAEDSGNVDTNHTGGGVILINAAYGGNVLNPGWVDVVFGPASAIRLGGAWRVSPTNYGDLYYKTNYMTNSQQLVVNGANFSIEIKDLPGFRTPAVDPLTIVENAGVQLNLLYRVDQPGLIYDRLGGVGITGTANTSYRLETAPQLLTPINWTPVTNVTLIPGTNWIPNTMPLGVSNRFYRAVWLPD